MGSQIFFGKIDDILTKNRDQSFENQADSDYVWESSVGITKIKKLRGDPSYPHLFFFLKNQY